MKTYIFNFLNRLLRSLDRFNNSQLMYKLKYCGEGVHFNGLVKIVAPEKIAIADNVHIGSNAYIDGRGGIKIGANTHISRNFVVHSSSHNYRGTRIPYDETYDLKPVVVERNVWIGTNVIVIPGINIGEGAIVGAGTVVTKDIPPKAIVGSQHHRIIKYRENRHYDKLDRHKSYGGISGKAIDLVIKNEKL